MYSKQQHEQALNNLYGEQYTLKTAIENFVYITNPDRICGNCTVKAIMSSYYNRALGSLLRKYDPRAFEISYNNFKSNLKPKQLSQ